VFKMYKFRTMLQGAERTGTGLFSYDDDPRVTRIGKYLRLTSLDELPQILNVIKGDMSIVGPRPPVTYELGDPSTFSEELKRGFTVKPGITGLAQVSGRNNLDWPQKIRYTNDYIRLYREYGVAIDLIILLRTVAAVFRMKNVIERKAGG
jgi:lipopolysaccharide/colanic/teichoic acid biosynthesis glycosyltransferase